MIRIKIGNYLFVIDMNNLFNYRKLTGSGSNVIVTFLIVCGGCSYFCKNYYQDKRVKKEKIRCGDSSKNLFVT